MERALCMSAFLLLSFVVGVHLSPEPELVFGLEGGIAEFPLWSSEVDHYVLYRVSKDGDLSLLVNCSQPQTPQPTAYNISCNYSPNYFEMTNLTMSQSGDYRAEGQREKGGGGRGGNVTEHRNFRLIICAEGSKKPSVEDVMFDARVGLCRLDSTLGHGSSLRLYRSDVSEKKVLVLDTNSSLEPTLEGLRGRLRVDLNNSLVTLSGIMFVDTEFYCTVWRGARCQSYSHRSLVLYRKNVIAYENNNVTLACTSKDDRTSHVYWSTPTGDVVLSKNHAQRQEVMYMRNGSQTGDFSLVIPSASPPQHSGTYECMGRHHPIMEFSLFVCAKYSPVDVTFYHGQSVLLGSVVRWNASWSLYDLQWYRSTALQPWALILDRDNRSERVPGALKGRVTLSRPDYSLTVSNLTAQDSGVYKWRAFGGVEGAEGRPNRVCSQGAVRLVYRDPFGAGSSFHSAYASLMSCALLGLAAAVVWVTLRGREGEQRASRGQSREGQQQRGATEERGNRREGQLQSGHRGLHDDVLEVAEDSV